MGPFDVYTVVYPCGNIPYMIHISYLYTVYDPYSMGLLLFEIGCN